MLGTQPSKTDKRTSVDVWENEKCCGHTAKKAKEKKSFSSIIKMSFLFLAPALRQQLVLSNNRSTASFLSAYHLYCSSTFSQADKPSKALLLVCRSSSSGTHATTPRVYLLHGLSGCKVGSCETCPLVPRDEQLDTE